MKKILSLLKRSGFQRSFYAIIFILINFFALKSGFTVLKSASSIGISYYYFWIVPSLILLYQIIRNDLIGWLLFFALYSFYLIWLIISIFDGIRLDYQEYDAMTFIIFLGIILIYLLFGYIIVRMKPSKK